MELNLLRILPNNCILHYIMCIESLISAQSFKLPAVCVTVQIAGTSHSHTTHGYVCTARRTSLRVACLNIQLNHLALHISYIFPCVVMLRTPNVSC